MHRSAQRRASQSVVDALGARGPLTCCLCCGTLFFGLDRIPAYCNQPVVGFSQNCLIELGPFAVNCSRAHTHTHTHVSCSTYCKRCMRPLARHVRLDMFQVVGSRPTLPGQPGTWLFQVPTTWNLQHSEECWSDPSYPLSCLDLCCSALPKHDKWIRPTKGSIIPIPPNVIPMTYPLSCLDLCHV